MNILQASRFPISKHLEGWQGPTQEYVDGYDELLRFLGEFFCCDMEDERECALKNLDIPEGGLVLDVACGTGANLPYLSKQVGPGGMVWACDLSEPMLNVAVPLHILQENIQFVQASAVDLPFKDGVFDVVTHFGALNQMDAKVALAEAARVTKLGGQVLVVDEGLAPWYRGSEQAAVVMKWVSPEFQAVPPLSSLPDCAEDVRVGWVAGGSFYTISFRVGHGLKVEMEARLPGMQKTMAEAIQQVSS